MGEITGPWADLATPQEITLESGQRVSIILPDLLTLAATGEIENGLISWVTAWQTGDPEVNQGMRDGDPDDPAEQATRQRLMLEAIGRWAQIARLVVVTPEFTEAQWRCAPWGDLMMLGLIATRSRVTDHEGRAIRGLVDPAAFRSGPGRDAARAAAEDDGDAAGAAEPGADGARPGAGLAA